MLKVITRNQKKSKAIFYYNENNRLLATNTVRS
jgi:hypothetical protein